MSALDVGRRLTRRAEAAEARVKVLEEALRSVAQYGSDTLSGRADGPEDREWLRAGVREMTARALVALTPGDTKP